MIDTVGLSPEQIAAIEEQAAVERKLAKLRADAREKRETEEREERERIKAEQEERRQKLLAETENTLKQRFLSLGYTDADWQKERGKILAQYAGDVAAGKIATAQDEARAATTRWYKSVV